MEQLLPLPADRLTPDVHAMADRTAGSDRAER